MISNSGSLAPPAKNRIKREISLLSTEPPPGISCYTPTDQLTYLHATITGPPESPFSKGIFLLAINIPNRYPFEPPRVRFLTPVHHPNIDSAGRICLDTLKSPPAGSWSPAVSLPSLLLSIRTLMGEPNAEDGLVAEVTAQFKNDYEGWYQEAMLSAGKEATDAKLIDREESAKQSILNNSECTTENNKKSASNIFVRKVTDDSSGDKRMKSPGLSRLALGKRKSSNSRSSGRDGTKARHSI